jgi:hypothetical protein
LGVAAGNLSIGAGLLGERTRLPMPGAKSSLPGALAKTDIPARLITSHNASSAGMVEMM